MIRGTQASALFGPRRQMEVGGQRHALAALPPGKSVGTHYRGGEFGWLWKRENLLPSSGFEPRPVQAVASRYIGYAKPAPTLPHMAPNIVLQSGNYGASPFATQAYVHTFDTKTGWTKHVAKNTISMDQRPS